jgi:Cys-tRNA(Pro)/Cys-tRNA(Cys) deacylase
MVSLFYFIQSHPLPSPVGVPLEFFPKDLSCAQGIKYHGCINFRVKFEADITCSPDRDKPMPIVNNVTRLLDSKKIPYQAFETRPEKLGAAETALELGLDPNLVYKTIVVTRPKGKPILAVIPGPNHVDLKLLAAALGEKKVNLPTEREAEQLTGLLAGGISPLALVNKGFQVLIDAEARSRSHIHVSGGQRGLNISLPVESLAELTHARFAAISVPDPGNT